jgi:tRNA1(Val) A37 N6-methylase TrmN6
MKVAGSTPSRQIALGQFWTSPAIADFMVGLCRAELAGPVLEAGFGQGAFLAALSQAGAADVSGFDVDPANLAHSAPLFPRYKLYCADYLAGPRAPRYRLAIGNPPYVAWGNITPPTRAHLAEPFWEGLANGQWDLLYAFMVQQVEQLLPGGVMCLIVPINFFSSSLAASLRRYLTGHGHLEVAVYFGEFSPFAEAAPNAVILRYRKHAQTPEPCPALRVCELTASRVRDLDALLATFAAELAQAREHPYELAHGSWRSYTEPALPAARPWFLAPPDELARVERLESVASQALEDVARIAVGMVSGLDAAYKLSPDELAELAPADRALVRQQVKAADCARWTISGTSPHLYPEDLSQKELETEHPRVWARLLRFEAGLRARYLSPAKHWWEWATVRNLRLFEANRDTPKLFVPSMDRSLRARWSWCDQPVWAARDVLCVVPKPGCAESAEWLLGWLNCATVDGWYRAKGNQNGHRTLYTHSHVKRIPYRALDHADPREQAHYETVIGAVRRLLAGETREPLESLIDQEIEKLVNEAVLTHDSASSQ